MSEEDIRNCLRSVEDVKKENVEAHRQDVIRRYWEHKNEAEILNLQLQLMNVMEQLRPKFLPDQSNNAQKAENENKYGCMRIFDAYTDNTCLPTSYTYKFFYLLTAAFLGFLVDWLSWRPPYLVTSSLLGFLVGLFPYKNIINLSQPTKDICDKCKLIENFIWKKEPVYDEDFKKMKTLRNYVLFLPNFSAPLCVGVNMVLTLGTIFGTFYLFNYLYPLKELSEPLTLFTAEVIIYLLVFSYLFGQFFKFICFWWMYRRQSYPNIIRWFF